MAIGFGANGAGATDIITTNLTSHSTDRTWFFVFTRTGQGGSNTGRIFSKRDASNALEDFYWNGSTIQFERRFNIAGTQRRIQWTYALNSLNTEYRVVFSYNSSTSANNPGLHVNGSSLGFTAKNLPDGAVTGGVPAMTSSNPYTIGNRSAQDRVFDGVISEFAIWDRALSTNERRSLTFGISPLVIPSCIFYTPLFNVDYLQQFMSGGGTVSITGCASATHPSIAYPQ